MKTNLYNYCVICLAVLLLASCSSPPVTPEPTATVLPSPTQPPPTITLTATKTPRPTRTPIPMGAFFGCVYFEGELVAGNIIFHPVQEETTTIEAIGNSSGCVTKKLPARSYWIYAEYWKGTCATTGAGCRSIEDTQIEIKPGETTEMDFEVQLLNQ